MSLDFTKQLEALRPLIKWNIALQGDDKFIYTQEQTGYFRELSLTECKMDIRAQEGFHHATPGAIANLVGGLLEDKARLFDPALFRRDRSRIIGFKNGCFDLQTGKLRPYTTNDFVLEPLPHSIPEEVDPDVDRWFSGVLSDWVGPEVSEWFKNVLAYFLFIHPNSENLWMNFFEAGRNGKSSCLKLLEKIVGEEKTIGCDLGHINRFSNATFQGHWLILGRDSSSFVNEGATSFIKNYSGDEKALVEIKGGSSFDTYTSGKIIVSTNNLIQSKDRSFGWYRRLLPIPFPNTFPLDESFETGLFKKIPDIIRILLNRAYFYRHNKNTISKNLPRPVAALKEETRYLNDRVAAFWELEFFDPDGSESTPRVEPLLACHDVRMSDIYSKFEQWHHDFFGDGQVEPSLKSFGGPYGAFMNHAKEYFTYRRRHDGRFVELLPYQLDKLNERLQHGTQTEAFQDPGDRWQYPD